MRQQRALWVAASGPVMMERVAEAVVALLVVEVAAVVAAAVGQQRPA